MWSFRPSTTSTHDTAAGHQKQSAPPEFSALRHIEQFPEKYSGEESDGLVFVVKGHRLLLSCSVNY